MADLGEWMDSAVLADAAATLLGAALSAGPTDPGLASDISALSSRLADMCTSQSCGSLPAADVDDLLGQVFDHLAELQLRASRPPHDPDGELIRQLDRAEQVLVVG